MSRQLAQDPARPSARTSNAGCARRIDFTTAEIDECFATIADDAGNLDLESGWIRDGRKKSAADRSMNEATTAQKAQKTPVMNAIATASWNRR